MLVMKHEYECITNMECIESNEICINSKQETALTSLLLKTIDWI